MAIDHERTSTVQLPFSIVRKGFDRDEVTNYFERFDAELRLTTADRDAAAAQARDLAKQLDDARDEIDELRKDIDRLSVPPTTAEGMSDRIFLPSSRFHQHLVEYAGHHFDIEGNLITAEEFERRKADWLPTMADREYVRGLMHPVVEPGKIANWIAPPATGIKGKPFEFEYVRL